MTDHPADHHPDLAPSTGAQTADERAADRHDAGEHDAAPVPGLPPPDQLLIALARLGQAVRLSAWRNAGPHGLSPLGADIVTFLGGDDRSRRQAEVVRALASTGPTVSDAVRTLVAKGLVARGRDVEDARAASLRLTDQGRAEYRRLSQVPEDLADAVAAVPDDDRGVLLRSAVTMMTLLQDRHAIPVSRMCATCRFFRPHAHSGDRPHHCAFVDTPFADGELRIECPDHAAATA